jgi:hypothetical protein
MQNILSILADTYDKINTVSPYFIRQNAIPDGYDKTRQWLRDS